MSILVFLLPSLITVLQQVRLDFVMEPNTETTGQLHR